MARGSAVHLGQAGRGGGCVGLGRGGGRMLGGARSTALTTPHGRGPGVAGVSLGHDGDHAGAGGYHARDGGAGAGPWHHHPDDRGALAGVAGVDAGLGAGVSSCHELGLVTRHAPGYDGVTSNLERGGEVRPACRACVALLASLSSSLITSGYGSRSGLIRDSIRRIDLDSPGSRLRLSRVTGSDAGNGLPPCCHHVLVTSVYKHPVVDVHVCHPHLPGAWGQNIGSRSSLTESLRDSRSHGIHAVGCVRSLGAGRCGSHS